jgi:hypothetical protein
MLNHTKDAAFENSAQRVVYSYIASLAEFNLPASLDLPAQERRDLETSGREFHAFLSDLYTAMYRSPGQFGLPLTPDICIMGDEADPKQFKQDVKKVLDRTRIIVERGMDFLLFLGEQSDLIGVELVIEKNRYAELLKGCTIKQPFLAGLASVGVAIAKDGDLIKTSAPAYPNLLMAWKRLAQACCSFADLKMGKFNFARADFRALDGQFLPSALDLYKFFDPDDCDRLARLHQFFNDLNYKPVYQIYGIFGWEVQYQGSTRIKASPLLRVENAYRYKNPLQVQVKCASVNRIGHLVSKQPRFLQEDFAHRLYACNGNACNWCQNKKGLGPSEIVFDGETRTVCWYHNPDLAEFNDETLRLIEQYALMHEELLQAA